MIPTAVRSVMHRLPGRRPEEDLSGRVVAITGAGSGIGRALAFECAGLGCRLALADISRERLDSVVAELSGQHEVRGTALDVSDRAAVQDWAEETESDFAGVDVLVNNAGITHVATFAAAELSDFERVINVNLMGVVNGCKAFLPALTRAEHGHLVNIASIFGMLAVPTQSAYNTTKFAVRGLTEAIREEAKHLTPSLQVHVVLPGGVDTDIAAAATVGDPEGLINPEKLVERFAAAAQTTPEQAARRILSGVRRGQPRILVGQDAAVMDLLVRALPVRHQVVLGSIMRRGLGGSGN